MDARFVQDGRSIDYTPSGADVAAGDVVISNDLVLVSRLDIADGVKGALWFDGVYAFTKASGVGSAIAFGAKVYWDATEKVAKTDDESGANKYVGKVIQAAGDDDTTVRVLLNAGGELPTGDHIADVAAATQGTYTASTTLSATPTKAEVEAELALIDAELDKVKVDIAADKAKINGILQALEQLGLLASE